MKHETYVTYEQAVKLKELGFDWECYEFWDTTFCTDGTPVKIRKTKHNPKVCVMSECNSMLEEMGSDLITAPTMAVAARWLRETKGIDIELRVYIVGKCREYRPYVMPPKETDYIAYPPYPTYELALSTGIDETLKLLEERL